MRDKFYLTRSAFAFALIAPLLLMVPFQNCTRTSFSSDSSSSAPKSANNGGNYDGKPFVHVEPNQPCPGNEPARSVIVFKGGTYTLAKDNCALLSPARVLPGSDVQSDPAHPAILLYKNKKYIFDATTLLATPPDLNCAKKNFGPIESLKIYLVDGPSGQMMTGVFSGIDRSGILAFTGTALNTSPSSTLTGVTQDSDQTVVLSGFDPTAGGPDGTNTSVAYDYGSVGSRSYLYCARPNGTL